jgi:sn-glycerol 3-phosphate transport system permease protein
VAAEKRVLFRSAWLPWALIAPQMAVIGVFFFWPAAQALYQSVLQQDAFGNSVRYVGALNFRRLLADPNYLASFWTTAEFSALVAFFGLAIALLLAAVAGVLWLFMFAPGIGIVGHALQSLGLNWNPLLNGRQAMALIVVAAVWKQLAYNFLFFVAGLQSIPASLIEAAAMDGAGPWHRFWTIVFPLLSPTTFFLLVINVIYAFFDTFAIVDATTKGGPGQDTAILVYKVYYDGFKALDLGGSAAQSVVLMAVVVVLTVLQFRWVEKKVQY